MIINNHADNFFVSVRLFTFPWKYYFLSIIYSFCIISFLLYWQYYFSSITHSFCILSLLLYWKQIEFKLCFENTIVIRSKWQSSQICKVVSHRIISTDWKNNRNQTYSYPRDFRLSVLWGPTEIQTPRSITKLSYWGACSY